MNQHVAITPIKPPHRKSSFPSERDMRQIIMRIETATDENFSTGRQMAQQYVSELMRKGRTTDALEIAQKFGVQISNGKSRNPAIFDLPAYETYD